MMATASLLRRQRADDFDPRAPGLSLGDAGIIFWRQRSPQVLASMMVLGVAIRLTLEPWGSGDAFAVAVLAVLHPWTEWLMHVYALHFRPRVVAGRTIDFLVSRYHRLHHADPYDPTYWYIPARSGLVGFGFVAVVAVVALPTLGLAVTTVVMALTLGLVYEWTHFLCHTSYRPRSRWYRRIWRHHRLHHFKNEHFWFGVSMHVADRIMGTMPHSKDAPLSETCRNLYSRNSS